ncbi:MAG: hypothetical protein DMENIID0002_01680 [Rickettsia endosymbiont of Sergentomyia squamirostris]|uniref:Uncharacterized protein n=1 Tax=Candidatus Tisiphia endosymbiont of Sergentomyia squamirostris TaxID=3113639 RepID=A0AAT9G6W7_9RICK
MAKSTLQDKFTSKFYQRWGEYYYGLAADMEDRDEPQSKIDASWKMAAMQFWEALVLGSEKAPIFLFKCFAQGVGVKKDADIATLMYGTALKLTPQDCAKIPVTSKPVIVKSMKPRIDALVKLVKQTHSQLPTEGVDVGVLNDQMVKFNHAVKLPSGKLIQSCFTEKSTAALTSYDAGGASSSQHNTSYETCPATSDSEEEGTVLAGKTIELHMCCEIM